MKDEISGGRRPIGEEIAFICERLGADEVQILGRALRRGVFEIYKAVVLHEVEAGRLDRQEASHLLGEVVVRRILGDRGGRRAAGRDVGRPRGDAKRRRPARSGGT
jgi:hypothetical protein